MRRTLSMNIDDFGLNVLILIRISKINLNISSKRRRKPISESDIYSDANTIHSCQSSLLFCFNRIQDVERLKFEFQPLYIVHCLMSDWNSYINSQTSVSPHFHPPLMLTTIALDLQITICAFLHPSDILTLRRVRGPSIDSGRVIEVVLDL